MYFKYTFPNDNVCTKITLEGFGEQTPTLFDGRTTQSSTEGMLGVNTVEKFIQHVKKAAKDYDDTITGSWNSNSQAYLPKLALVQAFTCDWQPIAEKNLEALGFFRFGPISKIKHRATKLSCWLISADDLCKRIGYVCDKDPRTVEQRGY